MNLTFDGGAKDNRRPGIAAGAAVITDVDGKLLRHCGRLIEVGSSNVGEWTGLLIGLEAALALGATHVDVRGDSELVVRQFTGVYAIRSEALRPLALEVAKLRVQFAEVTMTHYRRKHNKAADAICTAVMDGQYVPNAPTLDAACGKADKKASAAPDIAPGEVGVIFTCVVTMDPAAVREARTRNVSDEKLREQLIAQVERRLIMAGQLGQFVVSPKRVRSTQA